MPPTEPEYLGTQRHANDSETPTLRVLACVKCGDRHTVDVTDILAAAVPPTDATAALRTALEQLQKDVADLRIDDRSSGHMLSGFYRCRVLALGLIERALASQADDPSDTAYRLALVQIEHDGEVINRLTRALRVATHKPHDKSGPSDPDSGFPTCSECSAILTADKP